MENAGGQTMIGLEIADVFLKRHIQQVMSRAHQMWFYTGAKYVTQINTAELLEKELLDEVRRLTYFSPEDSIPLVALQDPYEFHHLPAKVILLSWHSILDMLRVPDNFYFTLNSPLSRQASTVARCYPSVPGTGEEPEDDESAGNVEVNVEVVEDSDATEDEEEKEKEEDETDGPEPLLPNIGGHPSMN
jgi:hypothetical protein